ncbi:response regulator transcription factor [Akkermansiaceae bacterium]|nr:response regulator transcription factor [Akkermansiaceae bacterium]
MLLVEDDHTLRVSLRDHFESGGWNVFVAADGEEGLRLAFEERIDIILLDLMLPKVDGYEICKSLRLEKIETPILMLTAKGQVDDVVHGLEVGADDYLVKPFSLRELDARVKVLMRRVDDGQSDFYFGKGCHLDRSARKLEIDGEGVDLTPKEFDLLLVFLQNTGRAMTRDQLLGAVWGHGLLVTARSVDRCVKTLRKKLGEANLGALVAVRGVGYRWDG